MHRKPTLRAPLQWDDVRLFLALCRSPTVGAASGVLGVDASTVSRRLVTLEAAMAATLFHRGRAGIAPTRAAEELLPVAERIEEAIAQFANAADALEREIVGQVRITCPSDLAEVAIAPLLPELFARHPALRVDIDATEAIRNLTRREADIALRVVKPERGDLVITRLLGVRWQLAASPSVARQLGRLRSLTDAPWVGFGERYAESAPARWFARHVRAVEPRVRSDSLSLQIALLRAGTGVGLVPEPSVAANGLVAVQLSKKFAAAAEDLPSMDLHLVTHRLLRDVPRVRAVWQFLRERLGSTSRGNGSTGPRKLNGNVS